MKKLIHVKKHLRKGKIVKAHSRRGSLAYKSKVDAAKFSGTLRSKRRKNEPGVAAEDRIGKASSSDRFNKKNLKNMSDELSDIIGKKPKNRVQSARRILMNADASNYPNGRFSKSHTWKGKKKK